MTNKISSEIKQYQTAYDRLNVDKVFGKIDFTPHSGQQKIVEQVQRKDVHTTVIACGRRLGKTFVVAGIATSRLLLPNAKLVLMSKSFKNANNLYTEVYKFIKKIGIKITAQNKTNLSFELENGSTFTSISERNVDSILGTACSTFLVDEAAVMSQAILENAVEQVITPTLSSYGVREDGTQYGEVILLSSPRRAKGYFYNQFRKGRNNEEGYTSIQLPTSLNPYIPKEFLARKRKELPEAIYNTEYLGEFDDNATDNVFYTFSYNDNVFGKEEFTNSVIVKDSTAIIGLDFGFSDATSMLYIYLEPFSGTYYILSEYMRNKLGIEEHAKAFKKIEQQYKAKNIIRYSDPSAPLVMSTLASSYGYSSFPALNSIKASIECINVLFHNKKLIVSADCKLLIESIELLEWKETETPRDPFKKLPKHLSHADLIASLRYAIYSHYKQYIENSYNIVSF